MRIPNAVRGLAVATLLLSPTFAAAQCPEVEANDAKATATLCALPVASTPGQITGTSIGATGVEIDFFRVTTAAQATPGFYRHRLIAQSTPAGHTLTLRGLTQTNGVINAGTDTALVTSSAATTPARFIQWYTTQAAADVYVRVTGGAATVNPYSLDYEVTGPVAEIAGPGAVPQGSIVVSTVGQTTADTDLWVYDSARVPIALYGNDDEPGGGLQSSLTQNYVPGTFIVAVSTFAFGNDLRSPTVGDPNPDDFDDGAVLDFPGSLYASSTSTTVNDLDMTIGGTPVTVLRAGPYDIQFVTFGVVTPVELLHFSVE